MRILLTLTLVITALSLNARRITTDEAMTVAKDFLEAKSHPMTRGDLKHAEKQLTLVPIDDAKHFLAFNIADGNGFVMVSSDSEDPRIIGYADKGSFDISNLPPQLKKCLDNPIKLKNSSDTRVDDNSGNKPVVIYETAEWGQGAPFNDFCPEIDGVKAPAGCVATAMAITMKYHNWPDYTRGGEQVIFFNQEHRFNFSDYSIDWDALSNKENPNFADEAARLLYSAGVAARMKYGALESAAEVWPISHKMIELYTYAKGADFLQREKFNDEEWNNMLMKQLDEVGPVIYCGNGTVGHCFVIDGYDSEGLFHVNWGWDGYLNGYFALDFSDVGGMSFGNFQGMIINLKPDKERKEYSKSFIPSAEVYRTQPGVNGWNFFSPDIIPGEKTTIKFPFMTYNCQVGFYRMAIVDEDDNILEIIPDEIGLRNADCGTYCEYPGCDFYLENVVFPPLKEGQRYQVVSQDATVDDVNNFDMSKISNDPKDFKIVLGGIMYPSYFYASGNRSDVVDVHYHVDENLPAQFINQNTTSKDFINRCLKGSSSADNIIGPYSEMQFEVICFDKNGNPEDPVYSLDRNNGYGNLNFNISVYSDKIDAYIKYESDGNSRNDEGLSAESIIEQDGLVYEKVDGGVALIGFDKIPDVVSIPENVFDGEKLLPVISIEKDALLFSEIKDLTINGANIQNINNCAFAGMNKLQSISINSLANYSKTGNYSAPFLQTKPDFVYFDSAPSTDLMMEICGISAIYGIPLLVTNNNSTYYLSALPAIGGDNQYLYLNQLYQIDNFAFNYDSKVLKSYNIPGLGYKSMIEEINNFTFPVQQMWTYAIDKKNGLVAIDNVMENVIIDNVSINGNTVEKDSEGFYAGPVSDDNGIEVIIDYTVNGVKEMTTVYSPEYNEILENTVLKEVHAESICFDREYYEGKIGEIVILSATVTPEDAADKTLSWVSSNENVAYVDEYGYVTIIGIGKATITASCGNVSNSCDVYCYPIPGDANWNNQIEITDAVDIANYVLEKKEIPSDWDKNVWTEFYVRGANANGSVDNEITFADASATVSLVLAQPLYAAPNRIASNYSDYYDDFADALVVGDCCKNADGCFSIPVSLDNSIDYVALQADITLPEGMTIKDVIAGNRIASSHTLSFRKTDDRLMRVAIFNLKNSIFANSDEPILEIVADAASADEVEISNIIASDSNAKGYRLSSRGDVSGVQSISDDDIQIVVGTNSILIKNAASKNVVIATVDGRVIRSFVPSANSENISLSSGIYVVKVADKTAKFIVR